MRHLHENENTSYYRTYLDPNRPLSLPFRHCRLQHPYMDSHMEFSYYYPINHHFGGIKYAQINAP